MSRSSIESQLAACATVHRRRTGSPAGKTLYVVSTSQSHIPRMFSGLQGIADTLGQIPVSLIMGMTFSGSHSAKTKSFTDPESIEGWIEEKVSSLSHLSPDAFYDGPDPLMIYALRRPEVGLMGVDDMDLFYQGLEKARECARLSRIISHIPEKWKALLEFSIHPHERDRLREERDQVEDPDLAEAIDCALEFYRTGEERGRQFLPRAVEVMDEKEVDVAVLSIQGYMKHLIEEQADLFPHLELVFLTPKMDGEIRDQKAVVQTVSHLTKGQTMGYHGEDFPSSVRRLIDSSLD